MNKSNLHLEPSRAKELFANGAFLIVAGVPIGTEIGVDLWSNVIGERFRGIKMIPPGVHYVWCSSKGPYGDSAPRVGFVHFFKQGEIIVREWDFNTEELRERQIVRKETEINRIRDNILELDKYLAPYNYNYFEEWQQLTDTITEFTVVQCQPLLGIIRSNVELQSCPDEERPRGPHKPKYSQKCNLVVDENDLLPCLKPVEGTALRFVHLPERVPENAGPQDISKHYMDCIEAVDTLITSYYAPKGLIEEIQLSFILFVAGHSVESLAHWRRIVNLLANSETATCKYKLLYMKFGEVLVHQLPRLPDELMQPSDHNTIYKDIRSLLKNLYLAELHSSAEHLMKNLLTTIDWTFAGLLDDDPEDMPVVVESP